MNSATEELEPKTTLSPSAKDDYGWLDPVPAAKAPTKKPIPSPEDYFDPWRFDTLQYHKSTPSTEPFVASPDDDFSWLDTIFTKPESPAPAPVLVSEPETEEEPAVFLPANADTDENTSPHEEAGIPTLRLFRRKAGGRSGAGTRVW